MVPHHLFEASFGELGLGIHEDLVWGSRFGVEGLGFRVWGSGVEVQD